MPARKAACHENQEHETERRSEEEAFTLIEMMVVIAIIALIAAMLTGLSGLAARKKHEGGGDGDEEQTHALHFQLPVQNGLLSAGQRQQRPIGPPTAPIMSITPGGIRCFTN